MVRLWVIGAVVLALWTAAAQATAHAIVNEAFSVEDVRRPVYRGNIRTREKKSDVVPEPTAPSTTATPIGESLRAVTKQLLQPTDMVATDVRTPPRVRTKAGEAKVEKVGDGIVKAERIAEGIGEAVPVDSVTQGPGLSTWILLSNDQAKNKPSTQATIQAVDKPSKKNETIKGKPTINKVPLRKVNSTTSADDVTKSPIILQDSKFKNRTPVIVGKIPTTPADNQTKTTVITTTPSTKKKIIVTPTQPTKFIDIVPTTSLVVETDTVENTEETSTVESTTTTKRTKRPGTKKKKKNKNRRRRPAKPEDVAESKITPQETNIISNKIDGLPNRPLSTRIYNYLAREVMPSVGVGIVGLVLTAGLAGLLLYPFGGGVARRNYEKVSTPPNNYYYSDYIPHRKDQVSPADKKIFTPASSVSGHDSYVPAYDSKYNNKFRYEHDYGQTVNGYAGNSEYSTLPDSVKNPEFSLTDSTKYYSMDPMSSHYKLTDIDSPQYKVTDLDNSQYKLTTGDSSQFKITEMDNSQYKLTNGDSSQYKITDLDNPHFKVNNEESSQYKITDLDNSPYKPNNGESTPYKLTDMDNSQYKLTNGDSTQYKITDTDNSQYKITNGDTSQYKITSEDSSTYKIPNKDSAQQYKLTDMHTTSYKLTDPDSYNESENYPSLTEYTSYTNAASVGTKTANYVTADVNQTDTKEEDKSDKRQPEFSALVGSPHFTNTDFVGSVSLTGSYGTEGHTGALASEHGPRALRTKRDVHDDFANEIDVTDEKILKKPLQKLSTETPKAETTTEIKTTSEPFSTTQLPEQEATTQFNIMNYFTDEAVKDEPTGSSSMDGPGGFMGFIKRLAQLKLKIGINLLRSTSDAFQKYFDNMTKRMEEAVRHLQKRRRSLLFSSSRTRRDNLKINNKKAKQHLKKTE